MAAGRWTSTKKARKSYIKVLFGFQGIKNKIPTAVPMFSGMYFSMAIIFTSPGVAVKLEINMADRKWKYFQFVKYC